MKVVWISHVSNQLIREHLKFEENLFEKIVRKVTHRPKKKVTDSSQWITNGFNEYENIDDIELHFVGPHIGIKGIQEFELNGIFYHFFRSEDDYSLVKRIVKKPKVGSEFFRNRRIINDIIEKIQPDIVHIIGAENPKYALAALDVDTEKTPLIVSLQTLLSTPGFKENYFISDEQYEYRVRCEREVLRHAGYIGTKSKQFKKTIWNEINSNAVFVNTTLFLGEKINRAESEKKYDLIYFAKDIIKAVDIVLNVLYEAVKKKPSIKMCIVGGCNSEFLTVFRNKIESLGLNNNLIYLGQLPTHDEVLQALRNARVALLPVKVDSITGTMREAMANGVPVVTTRSLWGTDVLNRTRKSAFIEEQDNYEALANDVIMLLDDQNIYNEIRNNAFKTAEELYSNKAFAEIQNKIYRALLCYHKDGIPIASDLCDHNPAKEK